VTSIPVSGTTAALTLNGGSITDGSNNPIGLTLAAPGTAGSLGASSQIDVYTGQTNNRATGWTATADTYHVARGVATTFASVLVNDVPDVGLSSPTVVQATALLRTSGTGMMPNFVLNPDGTIQFQATGPGTFTFSYYILDSAGHRSNLALVTITVI
jgi:hypothetical protein